MRSRSFAPLLVAAALLLPAAAGADPGEGILSIDHHVAVRSTVPAIAGQPVELYLRERVGMRHEPRPGAPAQVVLFVHGAGTPAEVAFDAPHTDYSWMAYLAGAGYDVFSVDMTGYGRSTRPAAMNDPCNLAPDQRRGGDAPADCKPSYPGALTTIASDWDDISAAVDYIRKIRHIEKLNLIGWSLGGPRAAGWAAQHPDQVAKLVLLAPAYNRNTAATPPPLPVPGAAFNTQNHGEFIANWNHQAPCPGQYEPVVAQAVWDAMLASDPAGAGWQPAVRRAPQSTVWGWTTAMVKTMKMPTLMVSGVHDGQVNPERVRDFYADIGSDDKVFVDLACSSHNAMWEKNHLLLFQASLEFLQGGTVNGQKNVMLRLGY